jgi:hypothetical protein
MFGLFRQPPPPPKRDSALPRFAYRLRKRPDLASAFHTAGVLRAITRMQFGPVSREWFERTSGLAPLDAESLLLSLVAQGAVEEIDLAHIAPLQEAA